MRYEVSLLAIAALLGACSVKAPPERLVLGVSGDRAAGATSAEADAQMRAFLDHKVSQICTLGYDPANIATLPAESANEIVHEDLRCKNYHLRIF